MKQVMILMYNKDKEELEFDFQDKINKELEFLQEDGDEILNIKLYQFDGEVYCLIEFLHL